MPTINSASSAGYAFSTYGEVAACWGQDIILVALISRHMRTGHKRLAAGTAMFAVYSWWLVSDFCSMATLTGELQRMQIQSPAPLTAFLFSSPPNP